MSEETIEIDLSSLTWGELEEIEKMTSGPAATAMLRGDVWPSVLVALTFVVKRRDNPKLLLEEIRRLPLSIDVNVKTGKEDELDPTSEVSNNGDSPGSLSSVASTGSDLPSFEG